MRGLPKLSRAVPFLSRKVATAALLVKVGERAIGLGHPAERSGRYRGAALKTSPGAGPDAALGPLGAPQPPPGRLHTAPAAAQVSAPDTVPLAVQDTLRAAGPGTGPACRPGPDGAFGTKLLGLLRELPGPVLEQALTHSSWVAERTASYERLEFLGDSVLGLAIATTLYERYPSREEGELARIKAFVVSRTSCLRVAQCLDLPGLIMERAPAAEQKRKEAVASSTVLGNVLEALIGASFLTHGYDLTAAAVIESFEQQIEYAITAHVDYKTTLQELVAPRGLQPAYRLVGEEGPPHARTFTSEVSVDGRVRGRGTGTTIKMSEQSAAREALAVLSPPVKGA